MSQILELQLSCSFIDYESTKYDVIGDPFSDLNRAHTHTLIYVYMFIFFYQSGAFLTYRKVFANTALIGMWFCNSRA